VILEDVPYTNLNAPSVATLFGASFSDALDDQDQGGANPTGTPGDTLAGIAIVANGSNANGNWQWWDGDSWENIGPVSTDAAKTFTAATLIRFAPLADYNGDAPTLTAHLIETGGPAITNGGTVDINPAPPTTGVNAVYTSAAAVLSQAITAVNDAPHVINGTAVTLAAIDEDNTSPAGDTVTNLFASHFSDPDDAVGVPSVDTFSGIAITANAATGAEGVWQYFTGGVWTALPMVATDNAFLVAAADSLRFVPAANFNGPAPLLTVHLVEDVDGGSAVATGQTADLTNTGDPTRYSSALTLGETVTAVNDAPVLDANATPEVTAINEDVGAPGPGSGTLVSALVNLTPPSGDGLDNVTDPDTVVTGLALTGADNTNGTWKYSLNGGASWSDVGAVTDDAARVLAADANTRVYFQPNTNFNGTSSITFRAWDRTDGSINGAFPVDPSPGGDPTAFSAVFDSASITVNGINDAPVFTGTAARCVHRSPPTRMPMTRFQSPMPAASPSAAARSVTMPRRSARSPAPRRTSWFR
jgi:hypothetical protein